jgi:hypothetical protein
MQTSEPEEKFDFQNIDTKLYLALRAITQDYEAGWLSGDWGSIDNATQTRIYSAQLAMQEFELAAGPLPDWAIARNWAYELVPGAQLLAKDGRQHGNGHIIKTYNQFIGSDVNVFEILTDAGSKVTFSEVELNNSFYIGDWISSVDRILNDFDRNGEFRDEQ